MIPQLEPLELRRLTNAKKSIFSSLMKNRSQSRRPFPKRLKNKLKRRRKLKRFFLKRLSHKLQKLKPKLMHQLKKNQKLKRRFPKSFQTKIPKRRVFHFQNPRKEPTMRSLISNQKAVILKIKKLLHQNKSRNKKKRFRQNPRSSKSMMFLQ